MSIKTYIKYYLATFPLPGRRIDRIVGLEMRQVKIYYRKVNEKRKPDGPYIIFTNELLYSTAYEEKHGYENPLERDFWSDRATRIVQIAAIAAFVFSILFAFEVI